jgi:hypothetical protein
MRSLPARATCALLTVLTTSPVRAQRAATHSSASAIGIEHPAVIPLTHGRGHLRTIRVQVGNDSADYLFDTGGGVTVISPQDSALLGCVPGGRGFGVRLTGEALTGRNCANVTIGVGPFRVTTDAGVMDLAKLLGPNAPPVRGLISLNAFDGRALTLDLAHDRLIVETPASLAERVKAMTPVPMRIATGEHGGQLTAYVGVRAPNGAMLWLEWDSENNASTLMAPHALALLGGDSASRASDLRVSLAPGRDVVIPVLRRDNMIHDGVLSAGFIERGVWTVDLAHGRMWVGPIASVLALDAAGSSGPPVPPSRDAVGVYETTTMVGGRPQHGVLQIRREHGKLVGVARGIGEDDALPLYDVRMTGDTLSYDIHLPNPLPIRIVFDGLTGTGTWGDGGVKRGGTTQAVKRR